ncbi:MAG: hypothetical protein IT372_24250 [Polyangiaceae bacterium]|nr:hypothetical protein [Polyangiaceae bacterium]
MDGSLESLFSFYVFTTGRRLFALRQVRAAAQAEGFTALAEHCGAAIEHDIATQAIERRWAGEPMSADTNPEAQRIDVLVDRTLGGIRDHAVAQTVGAPDSDPIHASVADFLKKVFPTGSVRDITTLSYVDELEAVDGIVRMFEGELAGLVEELNLGRLAERLAKLAVDYRAALESPPQSLIDWGRVRAARAEGQGLLLEAVALIVGKHHARTPEGTAARLALLGPILRQNEAIGVSLRARRTPTDVNPETGEEQPNSPGAAEGPGTAKPNG